jgi:hypothetical protein
MNKQAIPEMIEWCRKGGYEVCGSQEPRLETTSADRLSPQNSTD